MTQAWLLPIWCLYALASCASAQADCKLTDSLKTRRTSHQQLSASARQALSVLPLPPENVTRVRLRDYTELTCQARTQRIIVCPGTGGDTQYTLQVTYDISVRATDTSLVYLVSPTVIYTDGKRLVRVNTAQGQQLRPVLPADPADRKAIQCAFEAAQPYYQRIASDIACKLRARLQAYAPAGAY